MAANNANGRLVRTLYRSLWRAATKLERQLPSVDARAAVAAGFVIPQGLPRTGAASLTEVVRFNFRVARKYQPGEDTQELVELAFAALRQANKRVAALTPTPTSTTATAAGQAQTAALAPAAGPAPGLAVKPASVRYSVGDVVRHAKYGYKAVVIGWHERCRASDGWVSGNGIGQLPHGVDQPFYLCLVDIRDRPQAQVSYVAQDNVELLSDPITSTPAVTPSPSTPQADPLSRLVLHPLILKHFLQYQPAAGRYIPTEVLADAFPQDIPASVRSIIYGQARVRTEESPASLAAAHAAHLLSGGGASASGLGLGLGAVSGNGNGDGDNTRPGFARHAE